MPEPKAAPAHCLLVALVGRNRFPQPVGKVVFILQLAKNKGSGRGLGGSACGLLLGIRIPVLPLVLLTPGPEEEIWGSLPSIISQPSVLVGWVTSCNKWA